MAEGDIIIRGARANNLKGIDITLPRNRFVVVTGLSGSGKSSLAFDTLYAEGQRRYVESLSSYARQFLGRMKKPECDFIRGLPPAIAIEQRTGVRNSRSTVGTQTEIYDYLRLLFARVGQTISPISGTVVKKHTSSDVVQALRQWPDGTRFALLTDIHLPHGRDLATQLAVLQQGGYSRVEKDGRFIAIADLLADQRHLSTDEGYRLLIDRMVVSSEKSDELRLRDSLQTAFFEGRDEVTILLWPPDGTDVQELHFSKRFEADGITFQEPSELMFNFNNPLGACPTCEGFGTTVGIDENLVVPNKTLSVYDDAVMCWRGPAMSDVKNAFIAIAAKHDFPIHRPYYQLTRQQKDLLWHGDGTTAWEGIDGFFRWVQSKSYSIQYRVMLSHYRGKTVCPTCHGFRLRPEASYVKVGGCTIGQLVAMPADRLARWFDMLVLPEHEAALAGRLLTEIRQRVSFLVDVGLGYLTLDRLSSTLSGGESQRIRLATSIGSSLVGSLYILDEPSIGLHSRDTERLVSVLRHLQQLGNTVVVVEHDEDIIRAADYLIDIGPGAGRNGGNVVFAGTLDNLPQAHESITARYLTGSLSINVPKSRRPWRDSITIKGAAENNLKGIDVQFPLGVFTAVTGVSGSGKSTLVDAILYPALARHFGLNVDAPGTFADLVGDLQRLSAVEMVDQRPIGKSSRSNASTYLKAFDEIRALFSEQPLAKQMGYTPGYFSFNTQGGRCEHCKGEGTTTIEMQFMADITLPCEECHGKRFSRTALEVLYRGKSISDVLEMTVDEAVEFFGSGGGAEQERIIKRLRPLQDVGLGYLQLGQPSSTLSGGENQRLKLAAHLSAEQRSPTLFIFDEPTTGLHFHDINVLLAALNRLIEQGHTVVVIEHNLDVIKCADYIIDLGPDGGNEGGQIVACGTPEQVAAHPTSHTARFLRAKLAH